MGHHGRRGGGGAPGGRVSSGWAEREPWCGGYRRKCRPHHRKFCGLPWASLGALPGGTHERACYPPPSTLVPRGPSLSSDPLLIALRLATSTPPPPVTPSPRVCLLLRWPGRKRPPLTASLWSWGRNRRSPPTSLWHRGRKPRLLMTPPWMPSRGASCSRTSGFLLLPSRFLLGSLVFRGTFSKSMVNASVHHLSLKLMAFIFGELIWNFICDVVHLLLFDSLWASGWFFPFHLRIFQFVPPKQAFACSWCSSATLRWFCRVRRFSRINFFLWYFSFPFLWLSDQWQMENLSLHFFKRWRIWMLSSTFYGSYFLVVWLTVIEINP